MVAILDLPLDQIPNSTFQASDRIPKCSSSGSFCTLILSSEHILSFGKSHIAVLVFAPKYYVVEINIQFWSKSKFGPKQISPSEWLLHIIHSASTLASTQVMTDLSNSSSSRCWRSSSIRISSSSISFFAICRHNKYYDSNSDSA